MIHDQEPNPIGAMTKPRGTLSARVAGNAKALQMFGKSLDRHDAELKALRGEVNDLWERLIHADPRDDAAQDDDAPQQVSWRRDRLIDPDTAMMERVRGHVSSADVRTTTITYDDQGLIPMLADAEGEVTHG